MDECGGGEFVWYPNPKPSVIDDVLSHVQVFWRPSHEVDVQSILGERDERGREMCTLKKPVLAALAAQIQMVMCC